MKDLNIDFERAVRMLAEGMPVSGEKSRKPKLPHSLRVGVYLYENGYARDIVIAGLLHDALECRALSEDAIRDGFGEEVLRLVKASTKDMSIEDGKERIIELIKRAVSEGEDALIVKAADILDSFKYYTATGDQGELRYCMRNADAITASKPATFQDKIFPILEEWQKRYAGII